MKWKLKENLSGQYPDRKTELEIKQTKDCLSFSFICSKSYLRSFSDKNNDTLYRASVVEVFLDVGDESYYEIEVAPNGATFFAKILNRKVKLLDNNLFESHARVENDKYFVDIKINLNKIHNPEALKFNAFRIELDNEDTQHLYAMFPTFSHTFHVPEKFVLLTPFLQSERLFEVTNEFDLQGTIKNVYPYGNGHINKTYLVSTDQKHKYVLQKINNNVFPDVDTLMSNILLATKHLKDKGMPTLNVIPYKDGKPYLLTNGEYYRVYDAIMNAVSYESVENEEMLTKLGKTVGVFHKAFRDFDANKLSETIPNFHNTQKRYENLLNAIELDPLGRKKDVEIEIATVNKYKDEYSKIVDGIRDNKIKNAITHNDTKINNVMFDINSGEPICLIDLDTVMPGSYLYDVGDAFRSLFIGDNESTTDLSKITVSYPIFESFMKGYLAEMKDVLNPYEIEMIPFSMFLITMECGIRFLEDYIRGDVYFNCHYPKQNLDRCRTQIKLAEEIYANMKNFHDIVETLLKDIN